MSLFSPSSISGLWSQSALQRVQLMAHGTGATDGFLVPCMVVKKALCGVWNPWENIGASVDFLEVSSNNCYN